MDGWISDVFLHDRFLFADFLDPLVLLIRTLCFFYSFLPYLISSRLLRLATLLVIAIRVDLCGRATHPSLRKSWGSRGERWGGVVSDFGWVGKVPRGEEEGRGRGGGQGDKDKCGQRRMIIMDDEYISWACLWRVVTWFTLHSLFFLSLLFPLKKHSRRSTLAWKYLV